MHTTMVLYAKYRNPVERFYMIEHWLVVMSFNLKDARDENTEIFWNELNELSELSVASKD